MEKEIIKEYENSIYGWRQERKDIIKQYDISFIPYGDCITIWKGKRLCTSFNANKHKFEKQNFISCFLSACCGHYVCINPYLF